MWLFRKKKSADELAEEGNGLSERGDYAKAISVWEEALTTINAPLNAKSDAVWFQTSIGDALFMMGKYGEAYEYLLNAKSNLSAAGYENPFTMLRLGQCAYGRIFLREMISLKMRKSILKSSRISFDAH